MRTETLTALRAVLRADPSVAPAEIQNLIARLRESPPTAAAAAPYLGIAAAARHAATSRWTIGRWVKEGRLKAGRIGGVVRIRRADLDALLTGEDAQ